MQEKSNYSQKTFALGVMKMYIKENKYQLKLIEDFELPFGGKLNPNNRWVKLSELIPWEKIEEEYSKNFTNATGSPAKKSRLALGALIIKEKLKLTDEETVEQIKENPYLQFFVGQKRYETEKPLFDSSMMVYFRKRFDSKTLKEINEVIINGERSKKTEEDNDEDIDMDNSGNENQGNKGKLILDATCAPADVKYPTDVNLLNEAREKCEKIIDLLYSFSELEKKPRTYRQRARKEFMAITKQRKARKRKIRKAVRKQLSYVKRDIKIINDLLDKTGVKFLSLSQLKTFWVIQELYRQQQEMYDKKSHSVEGRIVSISQPHIRPILRGKRNASTEFGAKISLSMLDGYCRVEKLSWDNFNEGVTLKEIVESYKCRYGYYPKSILADTLYRNRENIKYCKEKGIKLSGPALGRKSKDKQREEIKQLKQDAKERNAVEGKFGEAKRKYGLGRVMGKLKVTSETMIMLQFIVMNLEHKLRVLFFQILNYFFMTEIKIGSLKI